MDKFLEEMFTPKQEEETKVEETQETKEEVEETKNPLIESEDKDKVGVEENEYFKTHFEGFDSIDSVKETLTKSKQLEEQLKEFESFKTKAEQYKSDLEEYKTANPYQDKDLYRLSSLKKDNEDAFKKTTSLLYGKLNAQDVLRMEFVDKHPEYKDKPNEVDKLVLSEFDVEVRPEKDEDGDPIEANIQYNKDRKELAQAKMDLAAETAKKELLAKFESIEVPEPKAKKSEEDIKKEYEEKTAKIVEDWKKPFAGLKDSFSKLDFSMKHKDVELPLEIELTKDEQENLIKFTADFIINQQVEATEENISSVKQIAINAYKAENMEKIISNAVDYAINQADESWRSKVHNVNPDVNSDKLVEDEQTKKDKAYQDLLNSVKR